MQWGRLLGPEQESSSLRLKSVAIWLRSPQISRQMILLASRHPDLPVTAAKAQRVADALTQRQWIFQLRLHAGRAQTNAPAER